MVLPCDHKKAYLTPEQAAASARGRKESGVQYLRVYQCRHCGAFHLTSQKPDPNKGKR